MKMDHGDMGHGHMPATDQPMCNMNMLFTWDTDNLCIIFRQWRVSGPLTLTLSLLGVAALTAGYELVRKLARDYEESKQPLLERRDSDTPPGESTHLLRQRKGSAKPEPPKQKLIKALFYGIQVFYSFFIMLLFMTYNGFIMLAVGVGATVGYFLFADASSQAAKSVACH